MAAVDKSKNVAQRTKGKVKEAGWRHDRRRPPTAEGQGRPSKGQPQAASAATARSGLILVAAV